MDEYALETPTVDCEIDVTGGCDVVVDNRDSVEICGDAVEGHREIAEGRCDMTGGH